MGCVAEISRQSSSQFGPHVFVQFTRFQDTSHLSSIDALSPRRPNLNAQSTGYSEQRPGIVQLCIAVASLEANTTQKILHSLISPTRLLLDTVGLLRINEPTDKTIVLEFRDFVPALHEVSMDWMTLPWGGVYRGELIMQLNGYLHTDVAIPRRQPRRKGRTT